MVHSSLPGPLSSALQWASPGKKTEQKSSTRLKNATSKTVKELHSFESPNNVICRMHRLSNAEGFPLMPGFRHKIEESHIGGPLLHLHSFLSIITCPWSIWPFMTRPQHLAFLTHTHTTTHIYNPRLRMMKSFQLILILLNQACRNIAAI